MHTYVVRSSHWQQIKHLKVNLLSQKDYILTGYVYDAVAGSID